MHQTIILASASPRRQELVTLLGWPVVVQVADVDEDEVTVPDPVLNVQQRAVLKGTAVAATTSPPHVVLAADTTVAVDGDMLNKPASAAEAHAMLARLRGRWHEVHTGMALFYAGQSVVAVDTTAVRLRDYTTAEIAAYIATGDPLDKAGAYAIQHPIFNPMAELKGCYVGVMGLSICCLQAMFAQLNLHPHLDTAALAHAHQQHPCSYQLF